MVRMCITIMLYWQGLHRAPPQQLDWGSDQSVPYVSRRRELQRAEWNQGKQVMCDHMSCHHVARGLVRSIGPATRPVSNHIKVTNGARHH